MWNMTLQEATAFVEKDQAVMRKLVQAVGLMRKEDYSGNRNDGLPPWMIG